MNSEIRIRNLPEKNLNESDSIQYNLFADSMNDFKKASGVMENGEIYYVLEQETSESVDDSTIYYQATKRNVDIAAGKNILGQYYRVYEPQSPATQYFKKTGEIIGDGTTTIVNTSTKVYCTKLSAKKINLQALDNIPYVLPISNHTSNPFYNISEKWKRHQLGIVNCGATIENAGSGTTKIFSKVETTQYEIVINIASTGNLTIQFIESFGLINKIKTGLKLQFDINQYSYKENTGGLEIIGGTFNDLRDCRLEGTVENCTEVKQILGNVLTIELKDYSFKFATGIANPWANYTTGILTLKGTVIWKQYIKVLNNNDVVLHMNDSYIKLINSLDKDKLINLYNGDLDYVLDTNVYKYLFTYEDNYNQAETYWEGVSKGCISAATRYNEEKEEDEYLYDIDMTSFVIPNEDLWGNNIHTIDNSAFCKAEDITVNANYIRANLFGIETFDVTKEYYTINFSTWEGTRVTNPTEEQFNAGKYYRKRNDSNYAGFTLNPEITPFTKEVNIIEIPEGIQVIDQYAFQGFLGRSDATSNYNFKFFLPRSLIEIGEKAFNSGRDNTVQSLVDGQKIYTPLVELYFYNGINPNLNKDYISNLEYDVLTIQNGLNTVRYLNNNITPNTLRGGYYVFNTLGEKDGDIIINNKNEEKFVYNEYESTKAYKFVTEGFETNVQTDGIEVKFPISKITEEMAYILSSGRILNRDTDSIKGVAYNTEFTLRYINTSDKESVISTKSKLHQINIHKTTMTNGDEAFSMFFSTTNGSTIKSIVAIEMDSICLKIKPSEKFVFSNNVWIPEADFIVQKAINESNTKYNTLLQRIEALEAKVNTNP